MITGKLSTDKLQALRDDIDRYLASEQHKDMRIYEALEESIGNAVVTAMKPLVDELGQYIKEITKDNKS